MKSILIVYSTTNKELYDVCLKVKHYLERFGALVHVQSCEITIRREIEDCDCLLLAHQSRSYQEQTDVLMQRFLQEIHHIDFQDHVTGMITFGSADYNTHALASSEQAYKQFLKDHNGTEVLSPLTIIKDSFQPVNATIEDWTQQLIHQLKEYSVHHMRQSN